MASVTLTLEVKKGPALSACLDLLNLADDLAELIPDWHVQDRDELQARAAALRDLVERTVKAT